MILDVHPGSQISDPDFFPIPDPGVEKSTGSRVPDPQQCFGEISIIIIILGLLVTVLVRIRTGSFPFSSSLLHSDLDTNKALRYC